jgi:branched-chain amino acid transport system permease protein
MVAQTDTGAPARRFGPVQAATWATLVALVVVPLVFHFSGSEFYLTVATRLVCLAIAAVSLNLILGYGGMVSFGHAAYIGIGAYAVGIPAHHETYGDFDAIASYNGLYHIAMAVGWSALFALITGALSLRTKGVYFIMITMAFSQMAFYLFVSMETYGGDDGLVIDTRSEFPGVNLDDPLQLYFACFAVLLVVLYAVHRMTNARFGMVIRGAMGNEARMKAIGFNTYVYRLTAYVIAGAMCGLAGALLGNFTTFISPEMMDWTRSGELIFMVILGGAGTLIGPVIGSIAFIVLEELFKHFTIYWHLPFGIVLIATVLFFRGGIMGMIKALEDVRRG